MCYFSLIIVYIPHLKKASLGSSLCSFQVIDDDINSMVRGVPHLTIMDYLDLDCQRRLIKTFVNSVFIYDDKVVLTFHYSGDDRTITLNEIDAGLQ